MLLTYLPTFEPRALVTKFRVTRSVRSKYNMLLNHPLTFEPRALVKKFRVT